ncbi:MAG TPA: hypothetical protein VHU80_14630, partial [Polyangiaceae bacterium]|nr:hypothetical protein [Polyangiaceae bacterium]
MICALVSTLLAGCGQKLKGTYSDPMGMVSYRFQKDGKIYLGTMGVEHDASLRGGGRQGETH